MYRRTSIRVKADATTRRCRFGTASRRSASSSPIRRAASCTETAAASTTTQAASAGATRSGAGSRAGSSSRVDAARPSSDRADTRSSSSSTRRPRAAGHRPCAECRRGDYRRFAAWWQELHGDVGADAIDARLHEERFDPRTGGVRLHRAELANLPDGAFVLHDGAPRLVLGRALWAWRPAGYGSPVARPDGAATVVTPPSLVALLGHGWSSALTLIHPSAR